MMGCLFAIAVGLACGSALGQPAGGPGRHSLDLSRFTIPNEIRADFGVSHCSYRDDATIVELDSSEIEANVSEREKAYSWYWLEKAVRSTVRAGISRDSICLASKLQGKDDGAFVSYLADGYLIEIIDGRALTILVRKQGMGVRGVLDVFAEIVNVDYHCKKGSTEVTLVDTFVIDSERSYGKVTVERGRAAGWFAHPVEWYRDGDSLLFLFVKEVVEPKGKVPTVDASLVIGGIPYDDPRPFLRFAESNRNQLAEEYLAKRRETQDPRSREEKGAQREDPRATHGAKLERSGGDNDQ